MITRRSITWPMPDSRSHRGAHPEDARDFAADCWPRLRSAGEELSFLFERAYAADSALKLVGDHHQLTARQRKAAQRAACGEPARLSRKARRLTPPQLRGRTLCIDGFNCLITVEAWLSGAPLFLGRDGALRDLASVHGSYRAVQESEQAATLLVATLLAHGVHGVRILLDRPVGNSGRTRGLFEQACQQASLSAQVELSDRVDQELVASGLPVASSDSWILDQALAWLDLPGLVIAGRGEPWLVDLS